MQGEHAHTRRIRRSEKMGKTGATVKACVHVSVFASSLLGVLYATMWLIDNTLSDRPPSKTPFASLPPTRQGTGGSSSMPALSLTRDVSYQLLFLPDTPTTPQTKMLAPYVPTTYTPAVPLPTTPKRPRTALKPLNRFPRPTTSSELAAICKSFVLARMKSNNHWAVCAHKVG